MLGYGYNTDRRFVEMVWGFVMVFPIVRMITLSLERLKIDSSNKATSFPMGRPLPDSTCIRVNFALVIIPKIRRILVFGFVLWCWWRC